MEIIINILIGILMIGFCATVGGIDDLTKPNQFDID